MEDSKKVIDCCVYYHDKWTIRRDNVYYIGPQRLYG
jgi:hypothetical protein